MFAVASCDFDQFQLFDNALGNQIDLIPRADMNSQSYVGLEFISLVDQPTVLVVVQLISNSWQ